MQYLLMLYTDESGWGTMTPEQQQQGMAAYAAYTQALSAAGVLKNSNRLRPSASATTLRITDGKRKCSTAHSQIRRNRLRATI